MVRKGHERGTCRLSYLEPAANVRIERHIDLHAPHREAEVGARESRDSVGGMNELMINPDS